jgi:surface protein
MQVYSRLTDVNIKTAVRLWIEEPALATAKYDHIKDWDTSKVTDMLELFACCRLFNDDISGWNVSRVTDMRYMFSGAAVFNQDLSGWDVSRVDAGADRSGARGAGGGFPGTEGATAP